jgi:mannose/cellobiose epimerase-like protein (N-acyl-D-glucosamine 2-epimerase family)
MEPRKRTELVNRLMEEANLMMGVLEKAMAGERIEESQPAMHGTHHLQAEYSLEDEHKSWGKVLRGLTEIQTELDQIEHSERQRVER